MSFPFVFLNSTAFTSCAVRGKNNDFLHYVKLWLLSYNTSWLSELFINTWTHLHTVPGHVFHISAYTFNSIMTTLTNVKTIFTVMEYLSQQDWRICNWNDLATFSCKLKSHLLQSSDSNCDAAEIKLKVNVCPFSHPCEYRRKWEYKTVHTNILL